MERNEVGMDTEKGEGIMEALKFLNELNRMCDGEICSNCQLNHEGYSTCFDWLSGNPQEAIDIISRWSAENPIVTMAEKFEEVFGIKPRNNVINDFICPSRMGFECPCDLDLSLTNCPKCKDNFWNGEYKEPIKE